MRLFGPKVEEMRKEASQAAVVGQSVRSVLPVYRSVVGGPESSMTQRGQ